MITVNVLCHNCGVSYDAPIDHTNKASLCPSPNCYKTKPICVKCNNIATFTQPDKETGYIVDVCEKHFIFMHMG